MTRVLVGASSAIVRAGLEALLSASPALEVVGSSTGIAALRQQIEALQPDVVLLELELQDDEILAALPALATGSHPPALVVLADDAQGAWAAEALRSGIRGLLPRQALSSEIVAAVEAAAAGLMALHPDALDSLLPVLRAAPHGLPSAPAQALTPRELEVLSMMAEGLGNKAIAWNLGISEHTVKFHVSSIFAKLNASSRTEAVTLGIRQGLLMI